jgi:hypothetical protein
LAVAVLSSKLRTQHQGSSLSVSRNSSLHQHACSPHLHRDAGDATLYHHVVDGAEANVHRQTDRHIRSFVIHTQDHIVSSQRTTRSFLNRNATLRA